MSDQYEWWRGACLAVSEKALEAYFGAHPIHDGDPMSGFYETRSKNKQTGQESRGVAAIWRDQSGKLHGRLGKDFVLPEAKIMDRWPFLAKRPIFHPTYKFVNENGGRFPDENPIAHQSKASPPADTVEAIRERVQILCDEADVFVLAGAAKSVEASNSAADLADALRKLEARAEELREAAKKPHLQAGRDVDKLWSPVRDAAGSAKERLKKLVITPFEVAEQRRREAEVKLEAEQVSNETGVQVEPVQVKRTVGNTASVALHTVKTAEFVDFKKTLLHYASNVAVIELIQKLANAAVRAGDIPPGCKLKVTQEAR